MNTVAERIARHLFDLTPALGDPEEAMMFCRGAALKFVEQFKREAEVLRPSRAVVDFKSKAAGERDEEI